MSKYPTEAECEAFDFRECRLSRSDAVKLKCYDCSGGNSAEVRKCVVFGCPIYPYRMGRPMKVPMVTRRNAIEQANKRIPEIQRENAKNDKIAEEWY